MKRLHNKIISGNNLVPNNFNVVGLDKYNAHAYVWKEQRYEKIYLVRNEMELPFTDVYELRAHCQTGLLCGYAFDFYCKNPIITSNYVIAANSHNLDLLNIKGQKNNLKLIFKLKGCNLYTMPGIATMLTISQNKEIRELLDI